MTKESDKGTGDIVIGGITYARDMVLNVIEADHGSYPESAQQPEEQESPATPYLTEHDVAGVLDISVKEIRHFIHLQSLGCIQLTKRKKVFTQALIDEFLYAGNPAYGTVKDHRVKVRPRCVQTPGAFHFCGRIQETPEGHDKEIVTLSRIPILILE